MSALNETRVWFVTDVRGSSDVFGKILNVVRHRPGVAKKPDVVLLSGDLTGGELCVIGVDANGNACAEFRGEHLKFPSESQRNEWAAMVAKVLGGYVVEEAALGTFSLDLLRIERLRSWLDLVIRTNTARQGARFLVVPGPHDPPEIEAILSGVPGLEMCDNKIVELNSELTLACSSALPYPEWFDASNQPRRYHNNQDDYVAHVQSLMSRPTNPLTKWVLNLYMLPKNTLLDLCPVRDEKGVPITGLNGPEMCHIGSEPVRKCIEKFKPVVSLHGFPPLDYRTQEIDDTRSFAPGTEAPAGCTVGTWLTFCGGTLTAWGQTREEIVPDRWNELLTFSEEAIAVYFKKPIEILTLYQRALRGKPTDKPPPDASERGKP
jgi:Icc-related predicted phosphoesterase